jgi:uncharacterized protein YqcC (DUF446 family)
MGLPMEDYRDQLCGLLDALEGELQHLSLWASEPPPSRALQSNLPFCVDTLSFDQWLQWVLLPQMRHLLSLHAPLPEACAIAPMAELTYEESSLDTSRLEGLLAAIDQLVTAHPGQLH